MSAPPRTAEQRAASQRRAVRWAVVIAITVMAAMGLVLMFLLAQATNNRQLYELYYLRLFAVNVVVAVLLVAIILWVAIRLGLRLRSGKFGSRLLVKLAATFALVGLVPGVLIYVVSYQFVSRSIESWFDVKVEGALDAGLNLGRGTLDTLSRDLAKQSRAVAGQLSSASDASASLMLERLRDQLGASDVALWSANGQLIASVGQSRFELQPERPTPLQLRSARRLGATAQVEGLDEAGAGAAAGTPRIVALALVPSQRVGLLVAPRVLQVTQPLPTSLVENALAVQEANREYQERALGREGLRRMYIGTLTLTLFLAVFGAVLLAVLLGTQLVRPLLLLADGVRQVAAGDLTPKAALQGRDELDGLTRSFAEMTRQLADARAEVHRSMTQVDAARANLQTILDNLTAGVIVLDRAGVVLSSNPGATRILRAPLAALEGRPLAQLPSLADFSARVLAQFEAFECERAEHGLDHWQASFELRPATSLAAQAEAVTLLARGAALPDDTWLLVFDDISEIVSAQRAQAWGEVARRVAHEIKNPLTPIQLSAERLEHKLSGKVGAAEQALVTKSVRTIVDQVDAMKRLVNEFREYARLPAAELKPLDLNALVTDVMQLYGAETSEAAAVRLRTELDPSCPPIRGDAQQLRQVVHNLVQNAQDACEQRASLARPATVWIRTQWLAEAQRVRLSVQDEGAGFPDHILKRVFEPYVTTKVKGTGLGLALVKKIADEHGARIDAFNRTADGVVLGAQVSLSFAIDNAPRGAAS